MSVANVIVSSQRACLLTDSSLYDADGTIIAFEPKAYPIDSWNGAITGRGNWWGVTFARDLAEAYGSFDEFLAKSAPAIDRAHRMALAAEALHGQSLIEVSVIGWSEQRDRAEAYLLQSPNNLRGDIPWYTWVSLNDEDENIHFHGISTRARWQLHRQGAEPDVDFTAETFDPIRHGLPLIEAQRRSPGNETLGEGMGGRYLIGGELWLTVVDRKGVRQGIIHSWPDKVGEPIRPEPLDESKLPQISPSGDPIPFAVLTAALSAGAVHPETLALLDKQKLMALIRTHDAGLGASRHQRRAAKAQGRKLARA